MDARPPVEELGHERDVVQVSLASDVIRAYQGSQADPLCPGDDQARAAELRPLRVLFLGGIHLLALELVVQLLSHHVKITPHHRASRQ